MVRQTTGTLTENETGRTARIPRVVLNDLRSVRTHSFLNVVRVKFAINDLLGGMLRENVLTSPKGGNDALQHALFVR